MSRNWVATHVPYEIDNGVVKTEGVHYKVTGTFLGGLLGMSPYATPFSITSRLIGAWDEDIGNEPAVKTGKLLEDRIIDYAIAKHSDIGTIFKAEEIFAKREGHHKDWVSDFEDDVFAGHVDGIVSKDGKDYILEVKTARDASAWLNGPPQHYLLQTMLYNHFITKQDKVYFLLGLVGTEHYNNPNSWIANPNNCFLFEVPIDREKENEYIERARAIYKETVAKGISTTATDSPIDQTILTYLKDTSGTMDDLHKLIEEYGEIRTANKQYEDANKENVKKEDELKERIKTVMVQWGIVKDGPVSIRQSERKSFDFAKADVEGFDYANYLTKTTVNTLNYKEDKKCN